MKLGSPPAQNTATFNVRGKHTNVDLIREMKWRNIRKKQQRKLDRSYTEEITKL